MNEFYQRGDECLLKTLRSLRDSDSDSALPDTNTKNGINTEDFMYAHFVNSPPLSFIKTRFEIPSYTGRLVPSAMRSWANLLVSTAKRRVKQLGVNLDTPRLEGLLMQQQTPFLPAGATEHALDASLVDITTARCLLLRAHKIDTKQNQEETALSANGGIILKQSESSRGTKNTPSVEHFDYANALSIEACLLYALNELGSTHLEFTMENIFTNLLSACEAFAAANRAQGIVTRAAYVNNWAMNLFRLSDIASRLERELTKGEVELAFPDSFMEHNTRDAFDSVRDFLLNASLHVLKSANTTDDDNELLTSGPTPSGTHNINNENAIRFIQHEILNTATPGNPWAACVQSRAENLRSVGNNRLMSGKSGL